MSDATWALLIGQVGIIAIMIVKDRRDAENRKQDRLDREQDRLDRESAAKILATKVDTTAVLLAGKVERSAVMGGEREERIIAKVEQVNAAVATITSPPVGDSTIGSTAANPVHVELHTES